MKILGGLSKKTDPKTDVGMFSNYRGRSVSYLSQSVDKGSKAHVRTFLTKIMSVVVNFPNPRINKLDKKLSRFLSNIVRAN